MLMRPLIALCCFALGAIAAEVTEPLAMIGFHEGTRRAVECKGGVLTGVEVGFIEDGWSFSEPFIGSVRLICSNKTASIEHFGDLDDTFVFGRLGLKTVRKVECEGGLGVAGFKWRAASIKNPDGAELRQAGLVLLCNRADNAPSEVVLQHPTAAANQKFPQQFSCKQAPKYAGIAAPKVTRVYMWYNRKSFAGMEPLECA